MFGSVVDAVSLVFEIPISTDFVEQVLFISSVFVFSSSYIGVVTLPQELSLREKTVFFLTSSQIFSILFYFSRSKP